MQIWEERFTSEKYGKESPTQFKYFCIYRDMGLARSLPKLSKELSKDKAVSKRPPKMNTLWEYSSKFNWVARAEAFDKYMQDCINKELFNEALDFKREQVRLAKERINHTTKHLQEITQDEKMNNKDKSIAILNNNKSYTEAVRGFYDVYHEGQVVTKNKNENTVKAEVTTKSLDNTTQKLMDKYVAGLSKEIDNDNK